jgi:hypothetical protein
MHLALFIIVSHLRVFKAFVVSFIINLHFKFLILQVAANLLTFMMISTVMMVFYLFGSYIGYYGMVPVPGIFLFCSEMYSPKLYSLLAEY